MLINFSKSLLSEALTTVSRAVSLKSNLPVLEGIYLKAEENGTLTLIGNDLEIGIEAKINVEVIKPGKAVLNAKMLIAIIKSLPLDEASIEVNDNFTALIKSGNSKFEIKGVDPMEFPELIQVDSDYDIELSNDLLKKMITNTSFCISDSDIKPVLKGCLLEIKGKSVKMVAVDKFRMAIKEEALEEELPEKNIIIPEKALCEIARILKDGEKVGIKCNSKNVVFSFENYRLVSRLIEGEFINYNSVISKSFDIELECSVSDLTEAITRATLIMTGESSRVPIKLKIAEDNINVSCETSQGSFEDNIVLPTGDANLLIGFNHTFLLEALRACDEEMVKIKFNKNINPLVITPVGSERFLYLVLPMKI